MWYWDKYEVKPSDEDTEEGFMAVFKHTSEKVFGYSEVEVHELAIEKLFNDKQHLIKENSINV